VANLAQLKWLDSTGLGGVAGACTAVIRHGGDLVLASAPPLIKRSSSISSIEASSCLMTRH
jgi:anti-anti-sigma regulatory factor